MEILVMGGKGAVCGDDTVSRPVADDVISTWIGRGNVRFAMHKEPTRAPRADCVNLSPRGAIHAMLPYVLDESPVSG